MAIAAITVTVKHRLSSAAFSRSHDEDYRVIAAMDSQASTRTLLRLLGDESRPVSRSARDTLSRRLRSMERSLKKHPPVPIDAVEGIYMGYLTAQSGRIRKALESVQRA